jgi:hypothetical protein
MNSKNYFEGISVYFDKLDPPKIDVKKNIFDAGI